MTPIDLRSDTVTRPTAEMRAAMAAAEVGDDVIDIDPTVQKLQNQVAELLGKEAAIFMPSGTMTNQIAVRIHCKPGDEFLCDAGCHIYNYEQGGFAQLSGVVAQPVHGEGGILKPEQLVDLIRPENEHLVQTRMATLENTHNRGAGAIQPYENVVEICRWAHENRLTTHLDGARLFNAVVASGVAASQWAQHFDTVSVCFSKGLGAPVGSALVGSAEVIALARRYRKLFGGGMRQAGIIAAGALYALENNIGRLAEDHKNAQVLAEAVRNTPDLRLNPDRVDTNMVIFEIAPDRGTAEEVAERLSDHAVLTLPFARHKIRAVTHLDVDATQTQQAAEIIERIWA